MRSALIYFGQQEALFRTTLPTVRRSIDIYIETGKVGGHKVPYFARALSGDDNSITLDTWMSYALLTMDEPSVTYFRRRATFNAASKLVAKVGKRLGISPRDCQAAIWSGKFRESGKEPQYFPIRDEYERWLAYDREFPLTGTIPTVDDIRSSPDEDISFDPQELEW